VEYLREGGKVLAVAPNAEYEERPVYINRGEIILMYTDGVTEVFDNEGQQFGLQRVIETVRDNRDKTSQQIHDEIYRAVTRFASPSHVFDDLTMIVLKRVV